MQLTKTDFIQYLNCPKSLWMLKHEPERYPFGEFSVFMQKVAREGYEVERYVQQLLESADRCEVSFQSVFETDDGLYARVDALQQNDDGDVILYEIKSSTSVKTDAAHNHLKDVCFQKICAERAGQPIDRVYLVHLNGKYEREGDEDPSALLTFTDVSEAVSNIAEETASEIDAALDLLSQANLSHEGCSCLHNSRANHCDTFSLLNPWVPPTSIYSLPKLSANKRTELVASGIFDLKEVPDDFDLTRSQEKVLRAAKAGSPQIDLEEVGAFIESCTYPLYFLDYETYASAVPILDRASPHKHFTVQYSLHILNADGALRHEEYLERRARLPDCLIAHLCERIGPVGSVVSWHASFEKTQNLEMARLFPDFAEFFDQLNERMVDLEDPFKSAYVDARFDGSTSIKKVLPVVCPDLGYGDLSVKDGSSAMEAWERLIKAGSGEDELIAEALLGYCERDTLAMVEIFRFLRDLIAVHSSNPTSDSQPPTP